MLEEKSFEVLETASCEQTPRPGITLLGRPRRKFKDLASRESATTLTEQNKTQTQTSSTIFKHPPELLALQYLPIFADSSPLLSSAACDLILQSSAQIHALP
jgi:hypothetical protein